MLERHFCRATSGARAAGGPARRIGLPSVTWRPLVAGKVPDGDSAGTGHLAASSLVTFRSRALVLPADEGSPRYPRYCGVDRLQITCHRRSENPSAVTAKTPQNGLEITAGTRAQAPPAMLAERHRRRGSQATWSPSLSLPAAVPVGYGPCAESPASDLLWRLADGDCLTGVQLGLMGVQLGGKVIWAGLRGCGCGAGTARQQREAVTVLPW